LRSKCTRKAEKFPFGNFSEQCGVEFEFAATDLQGRNQIDETARWLRRRRKLNMKLIAITLSVGKDRRRPAP
jgi:hypothetical protein